MSMDLQLTYMQYLTCMHYAVITIPFSFQVLVLFLASIMGPSPRELVLLLATHSSVNYFTINYE